MYLDHGRGAWRRHKCSSILLLACLACVTRAAAEPAAKRPSATDATGSPSTHAEVGAGALYIPTSDPVTAFAVNAGVVFSGNKWDSGVLLTGVQVDDTHTKTQGFLLHAQAIRWFGPVYGFGFGGGAGYMDFTNEKGGWDDSSFAVAPYLMPVALRFGHKPQVQLVLNAGAIRFFAHDVRPWGYFGLLIAI